MESQMRQKGGKHEEREERRRENLQQKSCKQLKELEGERKVFLAGSKTAYSLLKAMSFALSLLAVEP